MNESFLQACRGERASHTPVWMMRQAGRYLPEYQKVRGTIPFLELCKRPELCVEVTLQPLKRFDMDAAILFSDILIPIEAMGAELSFHEGKGPLIANPCRDAEAVGRLKVAEPANDMPFVQETIRLLRRELDVPLIGFAGAPFTCATYLIEGGSSKFFHETKKMMFGQPGLFHRLMDKISETVIRSLRAQAEAGAQALQLFDTWAGVLAPCDFEVFALPYVQRIFRKLRDLNVPLIYFANNGATLIDLSAQSGAHVLGLDWRMDIGDAARRIGRLAVQGNLDPLALFLPPDELKERIGRLLNGARDACGHIFNLGHGIHQQTPPEQVRLAVEFVHELSAR
ncbi:MAG: uroporphyrinogen decarboxylase [Desulfobulbaceae bacterium]|jgi:uroporphyrinogen decarboxylase|nr:uroporphyrinogen decarboxylase [Desulfobulbaceae bacterium]